MSTIPDIDHTIIIAAPIETVWETLTTPEEITRWWGAIGFLPEVGHTFHLQTTPQGEWDGKTFADITEITPPHRLGFTWYVPGVPVTHVSFTLRAVEEGTEVRLIHTGWNDLPFDATPIRDGLDQGWGSCVLVNLRDAVVGGLQ